MDHLTPLLTVLGHHIYLVGRYRQGKHAIAVSRSPGQGQGHRGRKKFFKVKNFFWLKNARNGLKCIKIDLFDLDLFTQGHIPLEVTSTLIPCLPLPLFMRLHVGN